VWYVFVENDLLDCTRGVDERSINNDMSQDIWRGINIESGVPLGNESSAERFLKDTLGDLKSKIGTNDKKI
jgi:hypothetical protein